MPDRRRQVLAAGGRPGNQRQGGADVVTLPAGFYVLTIPAGANDARTGDLDVRGDLTIRGASTATSIDTTVTQEANGGDRVLEASVAAGSNPISVRITGVGLNGGNTGDVGGGLVVRAGVTASLTRAFVSASRSGSNSGGGIYVAQGATATLDRVTVSANKALQQGGGIYNQGTLGMQRSRVTGNETTGGRGGGNLIAGSGGGITSATGADLFIEKSTIDDNTATRSGGIHNLGFAQVGNSTISGNTALGGGGGIRNVSAGAEMWVSFSTITTNKANIVGEAQNEQNRVGGGIANFGATLIMGNTLLTGNTDHRSAFDAAYSPDCYSLGSASFLSERDNAVGVFQHRARPEDPWESTCNLVDVVTGSWSGQWDFLGSNEEPADPALGALTSSNGGPTPTHALTSNSFVIDEDLLVGSGNGFFTCGPRDQRGVLRPQGPECDIGAVEFDQ